MTTKDCNFLPGDIVFTCGTAWSSRLIRWGTQNTGETETKTNHTGVGKDSAVFVEALNTVVETPWCNMDPGTEVWRNNVLTDEQRLKVAEKAANYVGRKYGYGKILLQGLDCLLGKLFATDVFFFRQAASMDRYPICSWVVAYAYDHGIGMRFGVPPNVADPDEIYDYVCKHPDWIRVHPKG